MSYTIDRTITGASFDEVDRRTREALGKHGFGVLTEIDVKATMKKKIDADMPGYLILGACNPQMAYKAIEIEPKVGAMLPCNVILREVDGGIEISAVDPQASMAGIKNERLIAVAGEVRDMLVEAIRAV
ncbi:MAG: DUF302 domain-containing protein [Mesorhizobium sp.]|nr:DUF302 domain-containing protein [Mesorhizobium sp.]